MAKGIINNSFTPKTKTKGKAKKKNNKRNDSKKYRGQGKQLLINFSSYFFILSSDRFEEGNKETNPSPNPSLINLNFYIKIYNKRGLEKLLPLSSDEFISEAVSG